MTTLALGKMPIATLFLERETDKLGLNPQMIDPIHRAFRPMTEETAFDVSELAIVTAIQAIDQGRDIVPLPLTIAARIQHGCILQNSQFTAITPKQLEGRAVAVRAYSQTTGAWVRAILETEYGVDCRKITWVTQDPPHVASAPEPANVVRDAGGASPLALLRAGTVIAAVFGNDMPSEPWAATVIPDADTAGAASLAKSKIIQINHVAAVSRDFFRRHPAKVKDIFAGFAAARQNLPKAQQAMLPAGRQEMQPSVEILLKSVYRQGLTDHNLSFDDVFGEALTLLG